MRRGIVCLCISVSLLFTGCFNYRDINKLLFTTAMVIDIDEDKNPVVYIEAFRSVESTANGEKMVFRGEGKTIFEALRVINLRTSYRFNVTQTKVYMFSQKAAEYGIDNFLDFFHRDQEFLVRPYLCVYVGDPAALMALDVRETKYIGIFTDRLLDNIGTSSRAVQMTINDYYNQRLIGDKTSIVTLLEMKKDAGEVAKLFINGGAVVKKDKMIDSISREEGQGFNFLLDNVESGTLEIKNPDFPGSFVTLEILKSGTKTKMEYDGDRIKLIKNIKVNTSLAEVQKGLRINPGNLKDIQETSENNIKAACYHIFDKYKEKKVDIFDIRDDFERNFPGKEINDVSDIIEKTDLVVNVKVQIESGVDDLDFINAEETGKDV